MRDEEVAEALVKVGLEAKVSESLNDTILLKTNKPEDILKLVRVASAFDNLISNRDLKKSISELLVLEGYIGRDNYARKQIQFIRDRLHNISDKLDKLNK